MVMTNLSIPELYADFINNFITAERFAEYYNIPLSLANEIIKLGRETDNFSSEHKGQQHVNYELGTCWHCGCTLIIRSDLNDWGKTHVTCSLECQAEMEDHYR